MDRIRVKLYNKVKAFEFYWILHIIFEKFTLVETEVENCSVSNFNQKSIEIIREHQLNEFRLENTRALKVFFVLRWKFVLISLSFNQFKKKINFCWELKFSMSIHSLKMRKVIKRISYCTVMKDTARETSQVSDLHPDADLHHCCRLQWVEVVI